MGITKLKSLSLRAFRSFKDEATVDFPDHGLVLIRGANKDQPGVSSGSGKTSLLLALAHALKYCPYSGTDLQSWLTDDSLQVGLTLATTEGDAALVRGPKSSLKVGSRKVTGASAIDAEMQRLIGLDPALTAALTYRPQQTRGLFLSKTDGEKKEFLSILLRLEVFEAAVEKAQAEVKRLEAAVELQRSGVKYDESRLESALARTVPEKQDEEVLEACLVEAKRLHGAAQTELASVRAKLRDLQGERDAEVKAVRTARQSEVFNLEQELKEKLAAVPTVATTENLEKLREYQKQAATRVMRLEREDSLAREAWEKELFAEEKACDALDRHIATRPAIIKRLREIEDEVTILEGATCPRCAQTWADAASDVEKLWQKHVDLENELLEIDAQESEVARRRDALKVKEDAGHPVDPNLAKMREVLATIDAQINEENVVLATYAAKAQAASAALRAEYGEKISETEREASAQIETIRQKYESQIIGFQRAERCAADALTGATGDLRSADDRLSAAKSTNRLVEKVRAEREAAVEAARTGLAAAREALAKYESELAAEQDFVAMTGPRGFMGAIFDEVLAEISEETNATLKAVPNVSHVTIRFKSEVTTQKGTTKRAITPVLSVGGVERPLGAALSGGMLAAVELATDLAVRRVISRRTGASPGWLVLDEAFEGLGPVEKEAAMAILQRESRDTLILVVDHSSETKELFSHVIEVECSNGRSTIR